MKFPQILRVAQEGSQVSLILTRRTQKLDERRQASSSTDASRAGFLKNHIAISASIYQILPNVGRPDGPHISTAIRVTRPQKAICIYHLHNTHTVTHSHTHTHTQTFQWPELIYNYRRKGRRGKFSELAEKT